MSTDTLRPLRDPSSGPLGGRSFFMSLSRGIAADLKDPASRAHMIGFISCFAALAMQRRRPPGGLLGAWLISELVGQAAKLAWQVSHDVHTIAAAAAADQESK